MNNQIENIIKRIDSLSKKLNVDSDWNGVVLNINNDSDYSFNYFASEGECFDYGKEYGKHLQIIEEIRFLNDILNQYIDTTK